MTDRIKKLCAYLTPCTSFADVGCDHGYCTEYMLKNGLCNSAVVSDISPQCLQKAQKLLAPYIRAGKCTAVCCDGLKQIDPSVGLVLIAGMGGQEMISLLKSSYIPSNFVLQPMKDVCALRKFLLDEGVEIFRDDLFYSGKKYYFVLCGRRSGVLSEYTQAQLLFGKGDVHGALGGWLQTEINKKCGWLQGGAKGAAAQKIAAEVEFARRFLKGEIE